VTSEPDPIAAARADGRTTLTEAEGKRLLASAGVGTTEFRVCAGADAAVEAAADLGYPVVAKVSAPAVTHKSEWADGVGVAVGLDAPDAVRGAATAILAAADERGMTAEVLIEAAAPVDRGTEVIVGGVRDPSFGPVVLVGLGGVFTELFGDNSHRIAPIDRAEARSAIEELQTAELLSGYRRREAADTDALAAAVVAVGDLMTDNPVAELDINPLLATADGVIALDALIVLENR
jgi:succinyl-CoA synthetase beta subunit